MGDRAYEPRPGRLNRGQTLTFSEIRRPKTTFTIDLRSPQRTPLQRPSGPLVEGSRDDGEREKAKAGDENGNTTEENGEGKEHKDLSEKNESGGSSKKDSMGSKESGKKFKLPNGTRKSKTAVPDFLKLDSFRVVEARQQSNPYDEDYLTTVKLTIDTTGDGKGKEEKAPVAFQWIHIVEVGMMSLDELQSKILNGIEGLSTETIGIIVKLFAKVKADHVKPYIHGRYLQPCVAHGQRLETSDPSKIGGHATFINYPYFSLMPDFWAKKWKNHAATDRRHPCQTLLQTRYRLTSTEKRDTKQVYRRLAESSDGNLLFVPQLWAVHIGHEYLITYSLHDREFLMGWPGAFITKDPLKKNPVTGLSMIRIKGLDGKLYMFPAESCKTWFKMIGAMVSYELCTAEEVTHLLGSKNEIVNADNWVDFLKGHKTVVVDLSLPTREFPSPAFNYNNNPDNDGYVTPIAAMSVASGRSYQSVKDQYGKPVKPIPTGLYGQPRPGNPYAGTQTYGNLNSAYNGGTHGYGDVMDEFDFDYAPNGYGGAQGVGSTHLKTEQVRSRLAAPYPRPIRRSSGFQATPARRTQGKTTHPKNLDATTMHPAAQRSYSFRPPRPSDLNPNAPPLDYGDPYGKKPLKRSETYAAPPAPPPPPKIGREYSSGNEYDPSQPIDRYDRHRDYVPSSPKLPHSRGNSSAISRERGRELKKRREYEWERDKEWKEEEERMMKIRELEYVKGKEREKERLDKHSHYPPLRPPRPPGVAEREGSRPESSHIAGSRNSSNRPPHRHFHKSSRESSTPPLPGRSGTYGRDFELDTDLAQTESAHQLMPDIIEAAVPDDINTESAAPEPKDPCSVPVTVTEVSAGVCISMVQDAAEGVNYIPELVFEGSEEESDHAGSIKDPKGVENSSRNEGEEKAKATRTGNEEEEEKENQGVADISNIPESADPPSVEANQSSTMMPYGNTGQDADLQLHLRGGGKRKRIREILSKRFYSSREVRLTDSESSASDEETEYAKSEILDPLSDGDEKVGVMSSYFDYKAQEEFLEFSLPPVKETVPPVLHWPSERRSPKEKGGDKQTSGDGDFQTTAVGPVAEPPQELSEQYYTRLAYILSETYNRLLEDAFGSYVSGGIRASTIIRELSRISENSDQEFEQRIQRILCEVKRQDIDPDPEVLFPSLRKEFATEKVRFSRNVIELINFYAPIYFPCELFSTLWAALYNIIDMPFSVASKEYLNSLNCAIDELLHDGARQILAGIKESTDVGTTTLDYTLPAELVHAFAETVTFLLFAGVRATQMPTDMRGEPNDSVASALPTWKFWGKKDSAQELMNDGRLKLISMLTTGFDISDTYGQAVQVEDLLALMVSKLESGLYLHNEHWSLVDMYNEYIIKLQLEIQEYPSRRLLQDLNYVMEELDIVRNIYRERLSWLIEWHRIRPYNRDRDFSGRNRILESIMNDAEVMAQGAIEELRSQVDNLRIQTVQLVELKGEDQNVAIFVFTVVTIIFLPLSFVTSFLGMNTVDIRDMDHKQSLFWTIGIPTTILVVVFASVAALKGNAVKRMWAEYKMKKKDERRRKKGEAREWLGLKVD